ncbi:MAG: hypothetical protein KF745_03930 [Phycisphaeraceae bacterium]|nr:hypothetical protein [Phycisphaeraceae bacterium]
MAQPANQDPAQSAVANAAARSLGRVATWDLSRVPTPAARDYRITALAMEIATGLSPDDEYLLRRLIEAWGAAGDRDRLDEPARRLVNLAPDDEIALLRLISGRIADLQDVDARLAAYEKFLGPQGQAFSPAIRSRLALDAALLLQEQGNADGFVKKLAQAIELDATNKDAAAIAAGYYSNRVVDPAGRLDLLLVLLRADPLDPHTHLEIARHLAAHGAYKGSKRFYDTFLRLAAAYNLPQDQQIVTESDLAIWNVEGPRKRIAEMRDAVDTQRGRMMKQAEQLKAGGAPLLDLPDPQTLQLAPQTAALLAAMASSIGDDAQTDWAMTELATSTAFHLDPPALDPNKPPVKPTEAEALGMQANLLWMRLWTGRQLDEADKQMEAARADPSVDPDRFQWLEGWRAMRAGQFARAKEILTPLAKTDPLAELGLIVTLELEGNRSAAVDGYADYARRQAGSTAGTWARTRARTLSGVEPAGPEEAEQLERTADAVPAWMEALAKSPREFMSLLVETPEPENRYGGIIETFPLRIRLGNVSPIPLALGPEKPINSRLIATASAEAGFERIGGRSAMEVLSVDRRLRLMPQQTMDLLVDADSGRLWYTLGLVGDKTARLRWRVLQGFRMTNTGIVALGPLSLTSETRSMVLRTPPPMSRATVQSLVDSVTNGSAQSVGQAISGMAARWLGESGGGKFTDDEAKLLAEALAARYPQLDVPGRIMMVTMLPPALRVPALAPFDAAALAEQDPDVLAAVILSRVTDPKNPVLARAATLGQGAKPGSPEARVGEFASLLTRRLDDLIGGYAAMTATEAVTDPSALPVQPNPAPGSAAAPAGDSIPAPGAPPK